jgi:hypothetical protein
MVLAEHGSFSAPISYDNFFLVVFQSPSLTFFKALASVFKPISSQLWASIFGVCILVGLALYVTEGDPCLEDRKGITSIQELCLKNSNRTWQEKVWVVACGLSNSVYNVVTGVVSMGAVGEMKATTPAGRIITTGYAFFILFFVANFTGQIAANTISERQASFTSLQDAVQNGVTLCMIEALRLPMLGRYPSLKVETFTNTKKVLQAMDDGICGAAVVGEDDWLNLQRKDDTNCNKMPIGGSVFALANALPVLKDLQPSLSWAITIASSAGWYEQEKAKAKMKHWTDDPHCTASGERTRTEQMDLQHFTGPVFLAIATSVCGVCVHILGVGLYSGHEEIQRRKRRRLSTVLANAVAKFTAPLRKTNAISPNRMMTNPKDGTENRLNASAGFPVTNPKAARPHSAA